MTDWKHSHEDESYVSDVELESGQKLLSAVERILATPEQIEELVDQLAGPGAREPERVAPLIISHYSNRSAMVGGATALPAMLPGVGTMISLVAGPLADMAFLLKWEVEMCLALALVHGYDIRNPAERQLAFLLAAVQTAEASGQGNAVRDALDISSTAIWNYTPRRVGKLLLTILAIVATIQLTRRVFLRAIPLVGIAVGASANKVLTSRVGRRAHHELELRRKLQGAATPEAV